MKEVKQLRKNSWHIDLEDGLSALTEELEELQTDVLALNEADSGQGYEDGVDGEHWGWLG